MAITGPADDLVDHAHHRKRTTSFGHCFHPDPFPTRLRNAITHPGFHQARKTQTRMIRHTKSRREMINISI
jgi:hypothetical protein